MDTKANKYRIPAHIIKHDHIQCDLQCGAVLMAIVHYGSQVPASQTLISSVRDLRFYDMNESNGGIARETTFTSAAWVQTFLFNGTGYLHSFSMTFEESKKNLIRLTIDGGEVFGSGGITMTDMESNSLYNLSMSDNNNSLPPLGIWQGNAHSFRFVGPSGLPLYFASSVQISIRRDPGEPNKRFRAGFVFLSGV